MSLDESVDIALLSRFLNAKMDKEIEELRRANEEMKRRIKEQEHGFEFFFGADKKEPEIPIT